MGVNIVCKSPVVTNAGVLGHEEEGDMGQSPEHYSTFALVQELRKKIGGF